MMIIDFNKSWPRVIHNISELTAVTLGILFNTLLLIIVKKQRDGALVEFGRIVTINTIIDFFLTLTTLIGGVQTDGQDGAMFLIADSYFSTFVPSNFHFYINYLWCIGLGFSILYQPVPFYHRYNTIVKNEHMNTKQSILLVALPMIAAFWNTSWMVFGMSKITHPESYKHLIDYPIWKQPTNKIPFFSVSDARHWPTLVFYLSCSITFPLATGLALYFYSAIHTQLKNNLSNMSEKTQKLQRQLNRALLSQIIFPCVFGIFPMVIFMAMLLFRTHYHIVSIFVTALFSFIPVINPLLNIILVTAYRHTFVSFFFCSRKTKVRVVSTSDGLKTNVHSEIRITKVISPP
ncbi:hypothetical protein M3Y96_00759300 [Aphelenchoides besseyi]|nr:hypothetical protein M3Y96_00759300 [Aphelenchoides besseyi]